MDDPRHNCTHVFMQSNRRLVLLDFNEAFIFLTDFREISNFTKTCPIGAVPCERTDGRTDMSKLMVAFRNFTNALKICTLDTGLLLRWSVTCKESSIPAVSCVTACVRVCLTAHI